MTDENAEAVIKLAKETDERLKKEGAEAEVLIRKIAQTSTE